MIYIWDGTTFEIVHQDIVATPVYSEDGVNYMWTHFLIRTESWWNPSATVDDDIIDHDPPASESITNLANSLNQKQRQMSILVENHNPSVNGGANVPYLQSPAAPGFSGTDGQTINVPRYLTDANNGPNPISTEIAFHGEKTAFVVHTVETWLVESANQRPYASNRFTMRKDLDKDYFETRTISGTAVFRADMQYNTTRDAAGNLVRRYTPDQYVAELIPACPFGFKRSAVVRNQSQDGVTFEYEVVDIQQVLGIASQFQGVISRVEVEYEDDFSPGQVPGGRTVGAVQSLLANPTLVQEAIRTSALPALLAATVGPAAFADVQNAFPTRTATVVITVFGTPLATKNILQRAALLIASTYRLNGLPPPTLAGGFAALSIFTSSSMFATSVLYLITRTNIRIQTHSNSLTLTVSVRLPGAAGLLISASGISNPAGATTLPLDPSLEEAGPIATVAQTSVGPASVPPTGQVIGSGNQNINAGPAPVQTTPPNSPDAKPPILDGGATNGPSVRNTSPPDLPQERST